MNEKLQARKRELEEQLLANNNERESIVENMLKPAQRSLTELQAVHIKVDGKYEEVCEMLGLDVATAFNSFLEEKAKEEAEKSPKKSDKKA
jgi:hypothetical protein